MSLLSNQSASFVGVFHHANWRMVVFLRNYVASPGISSIAY